MEHYKFNMAECCHAGMWQEDILGKTCLDCGFNTYHNDCGMYNERETKGMLTRINEEMEKATPIGNTHFRFRSTEGMPVNMVVVGELGIAHKIVEAMARVNKLDFSNMDLISPLMPIDEVVKDHVYKIIAPPEIDELVILDDTDPLKLNGTKQKKTRKGNNKKYFRRKRK